MKLDLIKAIAILLGVVMLFCTGFYFGRKNMTETKIKTIYVSTKPIHDTITNLVPYKVKSPIDTANIISQCVMDGKFYELFPEKIKETVIYLTKEDTTAIMRDWASTKYYSDTLFDVDTLGKCVFNAEVQYNELKAIGYNYTPVQKQTTTEITKIKHFSPYVGVGMTMLPSVEAELGIFIDDSWGIAADYRYNLVDANELSKYDIGIKVLKKF